MPVMGRVIIVSNRLPVSVSEVDGGLVIGRSIGGLATALSSIFSKYKPLWLGWTGLKRQVALEDLRKAGLKESIIPIQAPARLMERYYEHFATRILWPTMHSIDPVVRPTEDDWQAYEAANDRFAAAVQKIIRPGDVIWIHDFHLMRLPQYLRERGLRNRIGFFLHTPFPPPAHFLGLPHATEMLESLSQTEVVGFQTARDVSAFEMSLKRAGIRQRPGVAWSFPIGVDYSLYHKARTQKEVQRHLKTLRQEIAGRKTIVSISRLDYTKGIVEQLKGVEQFLLEQSNQRNYIYKLVVAPSREGLPEYKELNRDIAKEVVRINRRLGDPHWQPIDYRYENIDFPAVAAHYLAGDIVLLTPLVDGMNLIAKEYIATREDDKGMVVMGDDIGAAFQLRDAVLVNSQDINDIARGLTQAFTMSPAARAKRWKALRASIHDQNVFWWADQFMMALDETGQQSKKSSVDINSLTL